MPSVCDQEGIILPHETRFLEEVWKGYTSETVCFNPQRATGAVDWTSPEIA
jgi:hypothetical protein